MSEPQRVLFTALEGIVVSDANRTGRLAGKAAQDNQIGAVNGVNLSVNTISFVREGLLAVPGAGLSVDIQAGELCRFDNTVTIGADESRYQLARLAATTNVPLTASDPGQPRIDLIHAAEADLDGDLQVRNFINVTTRVVTPTATNKLRSPSMSLTVATGVAGATPAFPALPAGRVALWYVYVPAAAAAILDGHLMDARQYEQGASVTTPGSYRMGLMTLGTDSLSFATIRLLPGVANVNGGGLAICNSAIDYNLTQILQAGDPNPPAALIQIDVYVVPRGNGVPVGKSETSGLVPVARNGEGANQPANTGTPPVSGVAYYPLLSLGLTNVRFTTTRAAYVGTVLTDDTVANTVQPFGNGLALDRGGRVQMAAVAADGRFPAFNTQGRNPSLSYVSATQVRAPAGVQPIINGQPIVVGLALTFDITTNLVSGDVESPSTWYYCYVRLARPFAGVAAPRTAQRQIVARISTEAPNGLGYKPTPEAGFGVGDYCFVGSFFNNAASDIEPFFRSGHQVLFQSRNNAAFRLVNADIAVTPAFTDVTAIAPPTAKYALVTVDSRLSVTGDQGDSQLYVFHEDALTVAAYAPILTVGVVGGGAAIDHQYWTGPVALNTANQRFRVDRLALSGTGAAFNLDLWQIGYVEDVTFSDP
jgi:hypothetical protein